MAKIYYNITTYTCPHCKQVVRKSNDGWLTMLGMVFFIVIIPAYIAIWIIATLLKADIPKIGSPFITCKHCGKDMLTNHKSEWSMLSDLQKKSWSYRIKIRLCYILGVLDIFAIILTIVGVFGSISDGDWTIFTICFVIMLALTACIALIIYLWKKYQSESYIVISSNDYGIIENSKKRMKNTDDEIPPIKIRDTGCIIGKPPTKH